MDVGDIRQTILPEEIIGQLDNRESSHSIVQSNPSWMVEGIFEWSTQEGLVEPLTETPSRPDGLPLIIPGTRYAFTLTSIKWEILKTGVMLLADLVISDPVSWALGTTAASVETVLTLFEAMKRLDSNERKVLLALGEIKKNKYKGLRRYPTSHDLHSYDPLNLSAIEIDAALKGLVEKKLVKEVPSGYRVIT